MRTLSRALPTLLLLLALPAVAQYSIAGVVFHNPAPYTDAELLAASGLKVGQSLAQDSLVIAAHNLLDTGLFDDAQINLTGQSEARTVVVDLKPIPLDKLLPIGFENLVWFTPEELTAGLHARVPLYRGVASDAGTFPDTLQAALQQMLSEKGIAATLSHTLVEPSDTHPLRVVSFRIEQPSIRLGAVHLSMLAPTGSSAALTPGLRQAATTATRNPFNEGLSGLTLQDILLSSVRSAGYIQAALDSLRRVVAPAPTDPKIFLLTYTARIVTGDPYTVSALTFNPTPLYSAADFARDAKLHPRDLADASALLKIQTAIAAAYLSHGYLDIYTLTHPMPDTSAHTIAYTLEPIPGDIYHLHTTTPNGLSSEALVEFNQAWQMKPGDIYNPAYVASFIHNSTALKHLSTYAGSFQASADPATHQVDLTITFFPSNGQ